MTTPKTIRRWLKRNNPDYRLVRTEYLLQLQEERDRLKAKVPIGGLPIAWCYTHHAVRDHHLETDECDVPRSMLTRLDPE